MRPGPGRRGGPVASFIMHSDILDFGEKYGLDS